MANGKHKGEGLKMEHLTTNIFQAMMFFGSLNYYKLVKAMKLLQGKYGFT